MKQVDRPERLAPVKAIEIARVLVGNDLGTMIGTSFVCSIFLLVEVKKKIGGHFY